MPGANSNEAPWLDAPVPTHSFLSLQDFRLDDNLQIEIHRMRVVTASLPASFHCTPLDTHERFDLSCFKSSKDHTRSFLEQSSTDLYVQQSVRLGQCNLCRLQYSRVLFCRLIKLLINCI